MTIGATTTDLPAGVLYRVKATYKYVKEDVDELSFDVGEIIQVIEYDDPEDQVNFHCIFKHFWFDFILIPLGKKNNNTQLDLFDVFIHLQEEGWLMGQKEGGEEKGLFPANFTRPL